MGQDMQKGRRTEIEFLNGLVVRWRARRSATLLPCANAALTDIVKRVERNELSPGSTTHHGTALELTGLYEGRLAGNQQCLSRKRPATGMIPGRRALKP